MLLDYYLKKLGIDDMPEFLKKYLNIKCIRRLKTITYFCGMDYASKNIYDFAEEISRFDHSLSTSLLVWKFTHSKRMTLAALFHDVATPTFSHVIDYMNNDYIKQESTENYHEKIIKSSQELTEYLKLDNIDIDDIIYFKQFKLVDCERPRLCADRLDGVILTGISWTKTIDKNIIDQIIDNTTIFINEDNDYEFGFKSLETGKLVYNINRKYDKESHSNYDNYMMMLLANTLQKAIDRGFMSYNGFYRFSEKKLIEYLKNINDDEIKMNMYLFENVNMDEIPYVDITTKEKTLSPIAKGRRIL